MINTASPGATQIISVHSFAEIIENVVTKQRSLHAVIPMKKDTVICSFEAGESFSTPNYLTIQTGLQEHITLLPAFLQYTNHSCSPNIFFDTTDMAVVALKDIEPNEELSFFYPSTEMDMAQPFICFCGSKDCLQNIKGARYTSHDILVKYRLTDFIKDQLKNSR